MRRSSRRAVALITLLGLLAFQEALAAHACSVMFGPQGRLVPVAAADTAHDCAGMDKARVPLCLEHCAQGKDASNSVAPADVSPPVKTAHLIVRLASLAASSLSGPTSAVPACSTSPPPLDLSQRLRI